MTMLSLPEEIVLLTLDDDTGRAVGRQGLAAGLALAGAVLMELALAGRLDTDRDRLEVLDRAPTGDAVLDRGLGLLTDARDSRGALMLLAREEAGLRPIVLEGLLSRGLLSRVDGRVLLVFPERRYPKPNDRPEPREVRARLIHSVAGDAIPDPREALLLGLARATALLPLLLPAGMLASRRDAGFPPGCWLPARSGSRCWRGWKRSIAPWRRRWVTFTRPGCAPAECLIPAGCTPPHSLRPYPS